MPSVSAKLDGVRAKIARSEHHLDEFKVALRAGLATSGTPVELTRIEDHPEGKQATVTVTTSDPPPGVGVYVGDAVHNLRSALDHLICQLAIDPSDCNRTQFPIFAEDTRDNQKRMEQWIQYVDKDARTELRSLQPYQRTPVDPTSDLLWMLSELDNIDKHRLLLVVNPRFAELTLHVTLEGKTSTFIVSGRPDWRPLKESTVAFRLTFTGVRDEPETKVKVEADTAIGVVFAETGLKCDGLAIIPTVRDMIAEVKRIVDSFESKGLI